MPVTGQNQSCDFSLSVTNRQDRAITAGLEIATDTVANATKTLNLATKNSTLVATLATMFL